MINLVVVVMVMMTTTALGLRASLKFGARSPAPTNVLATCIWPRAARRGSGKEPTAPTCSALHETPRVRLLPDMPAIGPLGACELVLLGPSGARVPAPRGVRACYM